MDKCISSMVINFLTEIFVFFNAPCWVDVVKPNTGKQLQRIKININRSLKNLKFSVKKKSWRSFYNLKI